MGFSKAEIARKLSKYRSSIYRELKRNSESGGYFPKAAQLKTQERAKQKRPSKLQINGVLRDYIVRSFILRKFGFTINIVSISQNE